MILFFIGVVLIMTFNCATGLIMYAYYHDCDPVKAQVKIIIFFYQIEINDKFYLNRIFNFVDCVKV